MNKCSGLSGSPGCRAQNVVASSSYCLEGPAAELVPWRLNRTNVPRALDSAAVIFFDIFLFFYLTYEIHFTIYISMKHISHRRNKNE